MTKPTLLDITQNILSEMNSDEVNSISDTVESLQVATIVKNVFNEIIDVHNVPSVRTRIQLTAASDVNQPTHMMLEDSTSGIDRVYYDVRSATSDPLDFTEIPKLSPDAFLKMLNSRVSTDANIQIVTDNTNTPLLIRNDQRPHYWTTFDDKTLIFDSFDNVVDTTLQASKTIVWAMVRPQFQMDDTYVPELPENLMTLLLSEAKSTCFASIKQTVNAKVEQSARRLRTGAQDYKARLQEKSLPYPDFGRRRP